MPRERTYHQKKCEFCNADYVASYGNHKKSRFCSLSCSAKSRPEFVYGMLGKTTSDKQKKVTRARRGELHPNWKGGVSKIEKRTRALPEYKKWRSDVFERDNWTCQSCGFTGYVTAHHIKSFAGILRESKIDTTLKAMACCELWDISNGVTLCEECHALTDNYRGRAKKKLTQL